MSENINLPAMMEEAVKNPLEHPDPLVLAIFQNDFAQVIRLTRCIEYGDLTLADLSSALDYKYLHVPANRINAIVKRWGKKGGAK